MPPPGCGRDRLPGMLLRTGHRIRWLVVWGSVLLTVVSGVAYVRSAVNLLRA